MSGRFVRASKFRHVFGEPARKDKCYTNIRSQSDGDANHIKANKSFFAYAGVGGGGPLVVHSLKQVDRLAQAPPAVNVHKQKVLDWDFSPFLDNLIATAAEDCYVKITLFPETGLTADITDAAAQLDGHVKKVTFVKFHPVANNILASASADLTVKVFDIQKGSCISSIATPDSVMCLEWNTQGSMLLACCKDKTAKFFDPRVPDAVISAPSLPGVKGARGVWMDNVGKIALFGFSSTSTRQYSIIDPRNYSQALKVEDIDQSAGVLLPFYDPDNMVLYVGGKGDASIKYFEAVSDDPYLHYLSEFRHTESQKGLCFLPKLALDTKTCEVAMALRLMKDQVMPVSFQVPRKSDIFQDDLYPDTYAGVPALTEDQWTAGENRDPPLASMRDKSIKAGGASAPSSAPAMPKMKSAAELQKELADAHSRIKELEEQVARLQKH